MSREDESLRQQAVLRALRARLAQGAPLAAGQACWPAVQAARLLADTAGLRAYQLNAGATARRVLASVYPTVGAMVGADTLDALALLLWHRSPPDQGDLGEWGATLPALLEDHPDLRPWPWLPDTARLDWARHSCERAADAELVAGSLQRLGDTDPAQLHLDLLPCVRVLVSDWPIGSLWAAHQHADAADQAEAVATALAPYLDAERAGGPLASGEAVVVWRKPWRAELKLVARDEALWKQALIASVKPSLADLLDGAPPTLDFTAWLAQALTEGWLWRIRVLGAA